jgi:hypothetical protein
MANHLLLTNFFATLMAFLRGHGSLSTAWLSTSRRATHRKCSEEEPCFVNGSVEKEDLEVIVRTADKNTEGIHVRLQSRKEGDPEMVEISQHADPEKGTVIYKYQQIPVGWYEIKASVRREGYLDSATKELQHVKAKSAGADPKTFQVSFSQPSVIQGEIVEVAWENSLPNAHSKLRVKAPHWIVGTAVEDGKGSKKPAVYLIKSKGPLSIFLNVKVRIATNTVHKNISMVGKLKALLGNLKLEGDCSTDVGLHEVRVEVANYPDVIQHFQGDVVWKLDVQGIQPDILLENSTRLEVFFVLNTPASFYQEGVWVEALRFVCDKVKASGLGTQTSIAQKIVTFFHSHHSLEYDSKGGGRNLYSQTISGGEFPLMSYLERTGSRFVGCYDQAGIVQVLCGSVGITTQWYFTLPFGYILETKLVGIGNTNNPFFKKNNSPPIVQDNDPQRTYFGNHVFLSLGADILDACGGPHLGTESKKQFLSSSVDYATTLYQTKRPGPTRGARDLDMFAKQGITKVT